MWHQRFSEWLTTLQSPADVSAASAKSASAAHRAVPAAATAATPISAHVTTLVSPASMGTRALLVAGKGHRARSGAVTPVSSPALSLDASCQEEDFTESLAAAHGTPFGNATTSVQVNLCHSRM